MVTDREIKLKTHKAIPNFNLPSSRGKNIKLTDYKQRKNLVIFFFNIKNDKSRKVLEDFKENYAKYRSSKTEILAISFGDQGEIDAPDLPFPILYDVSGETARKYTHLDESEKRLTPSIFIADRFGALYAQIMKEKTEDLPSQKEIIDWLDFIGLQCPECGVDAWKDEVLPGVEI
jgi:peroxiredoxin